MVPIPRFPAPVRIILLVIFSKVAADSNDKGLVIVLYVSNLNSAAAKRILSGPEASKVLSFPLNNKSSDLSAFTPL